MCYQSSFLLRGSTSPLERCGGTIVTPRIRCARCLSVIRRCCHVICLRVASCHVIICMFFKTCIRSGSPGSLCCPFGAQTSRARPSPLSDLFSCAGVKRSRIEPRLSKRPWYTTGRPPVKFCAIWSPFDTPTVNRETVRPLSLCSPTPLPKWPKTHLTPIHALGRSITSAWPKTAPHLDSLSSQKL